MNSHEKEEEFDDFESVDSESIDEAELEDIEENSAGKIKKIKEELKLCQAEKAEHLENLQRAKAEFLNAKRRLEEERQQDKERAVTNQIEKLLPLCDSFQMARSNKSAWDKVDPTWKTGVESIYNQLQSIMTSYGVQEVHPQGEMFNPEIHDAMTNVSVANKDEHHKIISVIQNGYVRTINGKEYLIRPARVTVGEYSEII